MNQSNKPESGMAAINGAQIYYELKGNGHPLLLLHAGVADSRMWDPQFKAFAKYYQVIRFDMRGFGRSNIPPGSFANYEDVRALLDYLDVKAAYVLGISFGGLVALDFCLAYPNYVKALVLGAPSVSGEPPSERVKQFWHDEEAALENGDLVGATELNLKLWVDGPYRKAHQVEANLREKVRRMQLEIFQKEIPADIDEIELSPSAIERLGELQIPVQVIVGDLDLEEKRTLADRLVREMPNCQKVELSGVAHMLNMENPDAFNERVLAFLAAVDTGV